MGQRSMSGTWPTRGGWRWKNEDSIKKKEYLEEMYWKIKKEINVATRTMFVTKFKRYIYKNWSPRIVLGMIFFR